MSLLAAAPAPIVHDLPALLREHAAHHRSQRVIGRKHRRIVMPGFFEAMGIQVLAEESALRDLVRSWTRVMHQVEAAGFDLTFRRPPLRH